MKLKIKIIIGLLLFISITGCKDIGDLFKNTGPITTEERHFQLIENIELNDNVDLVIHHDSIYRMTVTAGSHLLDKIETNIDGKTLKINNRNKFNWVRSFNPTLIVDIWVPYLLYIRIYNSSGDITCEDTLITPRFDLDSYGSIGTYNLKLNCKDSYLKINNGPANINVLGITNNSFIYAAGDGPIDALNYVSKLTDLTHGGLNDVKVNVKDQFYNKITSIGNTYYKGNPTTIKSEITGSGKLIPL